MTAHQESNKSKNRQKEDWHVSRFFVLILFPVNLLKAEGFMTKHSLLSRKGIVSVHPINSADGS